jgi:hypothetical protein
MDVVLRKFTAEYVGSTNMFGGMWSFCTMFEKIASSMIMMKKNFYTAYMFNGILMFYIAHKRIKELKNVAERKRPTLNKITTEAGAVRKDFDKRCVQKISRGLGNYIRTHSGTKLFENCVCSESQKKLKKFPKFAKNMNGRKEEIKYDYYLNDRYVTGLVDGYGIVYDLTNLSILFEHRWDCKKRHEARFWNTCHGPQLFIFNNSGEMYPLYVGTLVSSRLAIKVLYNDQFVEILNDEIVTLDYKTGMKKSVDVGTFLRLNCVCE